jgi:hypothetical protein
VLELHKGHFNLESVPFLVDKAARMAAERIRETEMQASYQNGYRDAIETIRFVCNFPVTVMTNFGQVKGQAVLDSVTDHVLKYLAGSPVDYNKVEEDTWKRIDYNEVEDWLRGLNNLKRLLTLGYFQGKPIIFDATGTVECQGERENDINGYCFLKGSRGDCVKGFVIGPISATGTALIIDESNRVIAFHPPLAIDPKWVLLDKYSIVHVELAEDGYTLLLQPLYDEEGVITVVFPTEEEDDFLDSGADEEEMED